MKPAELVKCMTYSHETYWNVFELCMVTLSMHNTCLSHQRDITQMQARLNVCIMTCAQVNGGGQPKYVFYVYHTQSLAHV